MSRTGRGAAVLQFPSQQCLLVFICNVTCHISQCVNVLLKNLNIKEQNVGRCMMLMSVEALHHSL